MARAPPGHVHAVAPGEQEEEDGTFAEIPLATFVPSPLGPSPFFFFFSFLEFVKHLIEALRQLQTL